MEASVTRRQRALQRPWIYDQCRLLSFILSQFPHVIWRANLQTKYVIGANNEGLLAFVSPTWEARHGVNAPTNQAILAADCRHLFSTLGLSGNSTAENGIISPGRLDVYRYI